MDADADKVREAIRAIVEEGQEEQTMVGDLVLIAEVTGINGELQLFTLHNTEIARWKELGFLHDRIASITEGRFVLGAEED